MRILFLMTQDLNSPTGIGRFSPLARCLVQRGHQVTVVALHPDYGALPPEQRRTIDGGVDVRYVAQMHVRKRQNTKTFFAWYHLLWISAWATWALFREALTVPSDVIHISKPHPMNSLAGLIVGRLRQIQVWLDCDDYEAGSGNFRSSWQRWLVSFFEDRMPLWVDYVTTHNHFLVERITNLGVPASKIYLIPNGVDRSRFSSPSSVALRNLRSKLGVKDDPVILYVGSLSRPSHPVDLLLSAFEIVLKELPQARLLIVGGGEDFDGLKAGISARGFADRVIMTGRVNARDVPMYYHLSHVSVEPIYDDPSARGRLPIKLFESWAAGVPFVTSDVGDRRLILSEPRAGLLAEAGDAHSFARNILTILNDPALAESVRQRGLDLVEEYYWDRLAGKVEQFYLNHHRRQI